MKNIVGTPLPPLDRGTIDKIIGFIKTIFGTLKKTSTDTGKAEQTDRNSSLEDIDHISQIFSDFKEQVHVKAVGVENAVAQEVDYYVDELGDILQDNSDKVRKYGIHTIKIERQIGRISEKTKGIIDRELSKKVSLDNAECKKIIKMIPGSKKEAATNDFLKSSVMDALEVCCDELHTSLEEIYDDVESEVVGAVESVQKRMEDLQKKLTAIEGDNYEMSAEQQMIDAYYVIDACDAVIKTLQ